MAGSGDIVLVDFVFTNLREGKLRPALVLADAFDGDLLIARVTSQPHSGPSDMFVSDWERSGLRLPSWLQLSKLMTIEAASVRQTLGRISEADETMARSVFAAWLSEAWLPDAFGG